MFPFIVDELTKSSITCNQNCGVGTCVKYKGGEHCICPRTHYSRGSACIDLCTAKMVPPNICPNQECLPDEKMGFRCKCEGKYVYDDNKVTCRRKQMCTEDIGAVICSNHSATCIDDFEHADGFRCECDSNGEKDSDGKCKKKCELTIHQDECSKRLAVCDTDGSQVICKCPPLLTFDSEGRCTEIAKASYTGVLPVAKDHYVSVLQNAPSFGVDAMNYDEIKQDLRDSMHLLYGQNYQFADILNCSDSQKGFTCKVEVQFRSDPQDQVKLIADSNVCISGDSDTCFLPPHLVLRKAQMRADIFSVTDPCIKEIKDSHCGPETTCKRDPDGSQNFECTCAPGFYSTAVHQPFVDKRTLIHRCHDIYECSKPRACPNRTRCHNTHGSYECLCMKGYIPLNSSADPKFHGCKELCSAIQCQHGKCEAAGDYIYCRCGKGYVGPQCDQEIRNAQGSGNLRTGLIILSTMIVPLILLSVFMIYKYRILLKKSLKSNYFDDTSSLNLVPVNDDSPGS